MRIDRSGFMAKRSVARAITGNQVKGLPARLVEQKLVPVISESAIDQLAATGFDPGNGARPLPRAVQQQLENRLAQTLLAGRFAAGTTIVVGVREQQLLF